MSAGRIRYVLLVLAFSNAIRAESISDELLTSAAQFLEKIDNAEWINVRKLELKDSGVVENINNVENKDIVQEPVINIDEIIYSLIKKLDKGDGVSIDEVIKSSDNNEAENIIKKLLENGDIFEIKPGQLKVLE